MCVDARAWKKGKGKKDKMTRQPKYCDDDHIIPYMNFVSTGLHLHAIQVRYLPIQSLFVRLQLLLQTRLQPSLNSIKILIRRDPRAALLLSTRERKILSHDAVLVDGVNTRLLELLGKHDELGGVVELAALDKALCPGVDGGDGVGGRFAALLVLAVVAGDGAVGGFSFEGLAVGGNEDGGHEAEGAETLGDDVGLDVTVIVLNC
jgi:hypothetical protein